MSHPLSMYDEAPTSSLPWIDGFTAYVSHLDCELRDRDDRFIAFYEVTGGWYRPRRFRSDSNWYESIRVTIDGTTYYGRHCLDTKEIRLTPYKRQPVTEQAEGAYEDEPPTEHVR